MKYILGTASFGLNYGVNNEFKKVEKNSALEIMEIALKSNFHGVDSAQNYGNAQSIISESIKKNGNFHITSKLGINAFSSQETLKSAIKSSIRDLGTDKIDVLLIHDFETLIKYEASYLRKLLLSAQESNLVSKIGVSVYTEEEVHYSKNLIPEFEVFQIPENICDQRLGRSKRLKELAASGNQFFARSIFLQGMLLAKPERISAHIPALAEQVRYFQEFCLSMQVDAITACISYVQSLNWLEGIVLGANSVEQINQITRAIRSPCDLFFENAPRIDSEWLDPRKWNF